MKKTVNIEILTEDVNKLLNGKVGYYDVDSKLKTSFHEVKTKKLKDALTWIDTFISNKGEIYNFKTTKNKDSINIQLTKIKDA